MTSPHDKKIDQTPLISGSKSVKAIEQVEKQLKDSLKELHKHMKSLTDFLNGKRTVGEKVAGFFAITESGLLHSECRNFGVVSDNFFQALDHYLTVLNISHTKDYANVNLANIIHQYSPNNEKLNNRFAEIQTSTADFVKAAPKAKDAPGVQEYAEKFAQLTGVQAAVAAPAQPSDQKHRI